MADPTTRRRFLNSALLGTAATGAALSLEEKTLQSARGDDAQAPADDPARQPYAGDPLAHGKLGSLSISRLVLGGNLIGGFAHSRDLLYVSRLLREYNTDERIFLTLALAEKSGINTIQLNPGCFPYIERYRKEHGGTIQAIVCVDADQNDAAKVREQAHDLVERGANALYTHGMVTDTRMMNGDVEAVGRTVEIIKSIGVPGGIGSHSLETPILAEKNGLNPDYYVKTLHPDTYWSNSPTEARDEWCWYRGYSADHDQYHDNYFCADPKRTIEVMKGIAKPWFAFKVMAAGALTPQAGINYAFENGADFIIAGMFDFQVAADVEIAVKALKRSKRRDRPWRA
jgi:hypothetical protein